jgi:8-oxo-dGTP diphosphatase
MVDQAEYPVLFGTTQATWGPIDLRFQLFTGQVDLDRVARVHLVPFIGAACVVVGFEHGDCVPAGGGLEPGESVWAALERELAEEAGARLLNRTTFAVLRCHSRAASPYRPHEPHPTTTTCTPMARWSWLAHPSTPTAPSAPWRSR